MTEETITYAVDVDAMGFNPASIADQLASAIVELRAARVDRTDAGEWRTEAHNRLAATPQWEIARNADVEVKRHDIDIANTEARVRGLAVTAWHATGEKKPATGVQIKMLTHIKYDVARATEWARTHMADLLVLDVKAFEKMARVAPSASMPVEVTAEPAAYIDAKL